MRLLQRIWRAVRGVAEELSDQAAYRRHLAAHGREHSSGEYRRFQQEHFRAKYQRAKCC